MTKEIVELLKKRGLIKDGASKEEIQAAMKTMFENTRGQTGDVKTQMDQANQIRNAGGPQGIQAGQMYVAGNPLEHAASGYKRQRANRAYKKGTKKLTDLRARETAGNMKAGGMLASTGQQPPMQPGQMNKMPAPPAAPPPQAPMQGKPPYPQGAAPNRGMMQPQGPPQGRPPQAPMRPPQPQPPTPMAAMGGAKPGKMNEEELARLLRQMGLSGGM